MDWHGKLIGMQLFKKSNGSWKVASKLKKLYVQLSLVEKLVENTHSSHSFRFSVFMFAFQAVHLLSRIDKIK